MQPGKIFSKLQGLSEQQDVDDDDDVQDQATYTDYPSVKRI
jgi:hypothetical protein